MVTAGQVRSQMDKPGHVKTAEVIDGQVGVTNGQVGGQVRSHRRTRKATSGHIKFQEDRWS